MRTYKDVLGVWFTFIVVALLLYGGARYYHQRYHNELVYMSVRWNFSMPKSYKIEEVHKEIDFHGHGQRMLVVSCNKKNSKKTGLDYTKFCYPLDTEASDFIGRVYKIFDDEKVPYFNPNHQVKVKKIKKMKSMTPDPYMPKELRFDSFDFLVIVYDVETQRYYIFEELI